jgi:hypothetical protein
MPNKKQPLQKPYLSDQIPSINEHIDNINNAILEAIRNRRKCIVHASSGNMLVYPLMFGNLHDEHKHFMVDLNLYTLIYIESDNRQKIIQHTNDFQLETFPIKWIENIEILNDSYQISSDSYQGSEFDSKFYAIYEAEYLLP